MSFRAPIDQRARFRALVTVVLVSAVFVALAGYAGRSFVWNLSASLPRGLYRLRRAAAPRRGSVVMFWPPREACALIAARDYLPPHAALLKVVVALAGDDVCVDGRSFSVNGRVIGAVSPSDSVGRPLPRFRFCGPVPVGLAFVATTAPLSFDSRYFGPVPVSSLTVAVPVWTY